MSVKRGDLTKPVSGLLPVYLWIPSGFAAEKIPLSGAVGGSFSGDIAVPVRGVDRKLECKRRARAFGTLYKFMGDNYALVVRDNRTEPLVLLRLADFVELAR